MTLSDSEKNITFKYLYVKKFKWHNMIDTEKFHGHPKERTLYRASYNNDTKGYRLFYKQENKNLFGIMFDSLNGHPQGYDSEIVELSKSNILDLDLTESDLNNLIQWQRTDNKDIRDVYGFNKPIQSPPTPMLPTPENMRTMLDNIDEQKEINEFILDIQDLYYSDRLSFNSIGLLIETLTYPDTSDDSFDAVNIGMSKQHGSGHNVGKALNLLSRYVSENPRESLDRADLVEAIRHLITELNRINYHGL